MFERTFSFWRRLVGKPSDDSPAAAAAEADRRLWVRFAVDLETTYYPAGFPETGQLSARVRDISRGGANLIIGREFLPGELLSVELPRGNGHTGHSVLACIVRVEPSSGGEWNVGCIFAHELNQEDLEDFGAKRQKHPPSDQRTWMRFPCNIQVAIQPIGGENAPQIPAQVLNISASGIGLLVKQPIETGVLLNVNMHGGPGKGDRTILACVVHVTTQVEDEWALGCNFIRELSEEDLNALL